MTILVAWLSLGLVQFVLDLMRELVRLRTRRRPETRRRAMAAMLVAAAMCALMGPLYRLFIGRRAQEENRV